jgi:hypothetical protein
MRAGVLLAALYPLQSYAAQLTALSAKPWFGRQRGQCRNDGPYSFKCANFTTDAINYDQQGQTSFNTFLNNPVFTNETNGFSGDDLYTDFLIRFTGQTFLNAGDNSFVVAHDDGVVLTIEGNTVVDHPGRTSEDDTPFTVTVASAGLYDFVLDYGECCGPPAVLKFDVNAQPVGPTPEPGAMVLIGSALVGLSVARFRKRA